MTQHDSPRSQTQDLKYGRTFTVHSLLLIKIEAYTVSFSSLNMDLIFENYTIQSAEDDNAINLELPLQPLQRALKSALTGLSANLRLTKKDGAPILSMTITTMTHSDAGGPTGPRLAANLNDDPFADEDEFHAGHLETSLRLGHEKVITQDIPVRVLHPKTVEMIMQPTVREPDVHIELPPLLQLKAISDRFTKLALASSSNSKAPKLELSANMHGSLRLRIATEATDICSIWPNLDHPELKPEELNMPLEEHPSTKFREAGPDRWATIHVDGKDWSRVLSVGRLDARFIACFSDDHALILYAYVRNAEGEDEHGSESVITVS